MRASTGRAVQTPDEAVYHELPCILAVEGLNVVLDEQTHMWILAEVLS